VPVKIVHPDHVEIVGLGHVLITAPHATSAEADLYTGQIVEEAALTSRSFAVIGKVNKEFSDPNRIQSAQSELRGSIKGYIAEDGIQYILDVRGKKEPGVDIGTAAGQTCSYSAIELVKSRLAQDFTVTAKNNHNQSESAGAIASYDRKDASGKFAVETIQIQFGQEERQFQREKIIRDISEIADILNARLVASGAD